MIPWANPVSPTRNLNAKSNKFQGKKCPVCRELITNPLDYIYSKRLLGDGTYMTVELCRTCRDAGH